MQKLMCLGLSQRQTQAEARFDAHLRKRLDEETNLEPLIQEKPASFKSQVNQVSFRFPLCGRPLIFVPRDERIGETKVTI